MIFRSSNSSRKLKLSPIHGGSTLYFAAAFRKRGSALPLLQGIKGKDAVDDGFLLLLAATGDVTLAVPERPAAGVRIDLDSNRPDTDFRYGATGDLIELGRRQFRNVSLFHCLLPCIDESSACRRSEPSKQFARIGRSDL
jgi:hypothetical protein